MTANLSLYLTDAEKQQTKVLADVLVRRVAAMPKRGEKPFGVSQFSWEWAAQERGIAWMELA